jgi:hypothetical protein
MLVSGYEKGHKMVENVLYYIVMDYFFVGRGDGRVDGN